MSQMQLDFSLPSCYCGEPAVMKTSWSDDNPGRRFVGCKKYGQVGECNFFDWVDPKFPPQANRVILGLLKKLNKVENLSKASRAEELNVAPKAVGGDRFWKTIFKLCFVVVFVAVMLKFIV